LPEDNLPRLFLRASFERERLSDAVVADVFVFITNGIIYSSLIVGVFKGEILSASTQFNGRGSQCFDWQYFDFIEW